jgi:hypothetical protein
MRPRSSIEAHRSTKEENLTEMFYPFGSNAGQEANFDLPSLGTRYWY